MSEIKEVLLNVINAWEKLPGGRCYTPEQIADWLKDDMKPAMDKARKALKLPIPTKKKLRVFDYGA